MGKRAVIRLDGYLEQGFTVTLEVGEEGNVHFTEVAGRLPPNPELIKCLGMWQQNYRELAENTRITLQKVKVQTSSLSQIDTCRRLAQDLQGYLRNWLQSPSFQDVEKRLREALVQEEPIRVLLRTQDNRLRGLPWHLWEFIERYSQAEIAFSTVPGKISFRVKPREKVRVLAILGNSEGIDTEADRKMLQGLPHADVKFLVEPSRQQINDQLWEQSWDIFFFAGHSETEENQGRIYINRQDSLTIDELKYSLRQAIGHGLQLAIFNSCDGLGLAAELEQLHLPQLIVMREPVPDKVAQEFLKHFLNAFARGDSLYVAERKARERLQGMEDNFPCASWLPIIFQNPTVVPPTWERLTNPCGSKEPRRFWRRLGALCVASVAVTGVVMGVRRLGLLETLELPAYDMMMRMRPQESPDERLVLITITGEDLQLPEQKERRAGLSDQALDLVLKKLEPHKPRLIGLDILRDFSVNPKYKDLVNRMGKDGFTGICYIGGDKPNNNGTPKPPEVKIEQVGFSDVLTDKPYKVIRRHLLHTALRSTTRCRAPDAFSLNIALRYLKKEGIEPMFTSPPEQYLRLGNVVFEELETHSSGYQTLKASGHQILLNFRSVNGSPLNITDNKLTLKQVINDEVNLDFIKDKIVLIGVDAPTIKDYFLTPYTQGQEEVMPGVILHAQMISQIISAALGERSLLTVWPVWNEVLWVWAWSAVGGLLAWYWRSPIKLGLAVAIALSSSYTLCYVSFISLTGAAVWIPFIPSIIALLVTSGSVITYCVYHNQKSRQI